MISSVHAVFRRTPLAAVCAVALIAAGCGGGGGGGGGGSGDGDGGGSSNGGADLSSEERAALAATTSSSAGGLAQGLAEGAVADAAGSDDPEGAGQPSAFGPVTSASRTVATELDCTTGAVRFTESTILNMDDEAFPDAFSNADGFDDSRGTPDHLHLRADCDDDAITFNGSFDVTQLQDVDGTAGSAIVYKAGGYAGPNRGNAPDLGESYSSSSDFGSSSIRGELFACNGCVAGDLADWTGTPDLDSTAVGFLDMEFDFTVGDESEAFAIRLGESRTSPFRLQTIHEGGDSATVDINGRFAYDGEEQCSFDVTYDTVTPPTVDDLNAANPTTTNGRIDVTLNDNGSGTYVVEYDSNGNVTVDGETVDISDVEDDCDYGGEPGGGDDSDSGNGGTTSGPDALSGFWQSECIAVGQDRGATVYGQVGLLFDTTNETYSETATAYSDASCSDKTDEINLTGEDYETPGESTAVEGAWEINLRGGSQRDDIFEVFRIQDDILTFGEYPVAGPDQEEFRPDDIPDDAVEFTPITSP